MADPGHHARPTGPAPGSGAAGVPPETDLDHPGDWIGPYKIIELLGHGGFGVVWLAERRDAIVQRVAIKVLKPGMDSRAVVARFEQERQALAVMDHPNIAKVFDAGTTQRGLPYFVMEHVAGEPITTYCDRHNLTIRDRLELFLPVCSAVQHAHHKGLIHRDLKPSNILVTVREGQAAPKVIDFGVAKAISHTLTDKTIFTAHGVLVGTPEYMSPEQAEMGAADIDTRTDVYSLGVILYELLSGVLPFDSASLRSAGYREIQRIIREEAPPKPSTRLSSLGVGEGADIAKKRQSRREALSRELRDELDWIPLKALRKDRTERYRTPEDLADDVRRYLRGEALEAGPESAAYRARKFVKRHRGPAAAAAAVAATLVLGMVGTLWQAREARRAEGQARQERDAALAVTRFVESMLTGVDPRARGGRVDVRVREMLDLAAAAVAPEGVPAVDRRTEGDVRRVLGASYAATGRFDEAVEHFARAVEIERELAPGGASLRLAAVLDQYAECRGDRGEFELATAAAEEALRLFRSLHPGDHAQTAGAIHTLAWLDLRQGRFDRAEAGCAEALAMHRRIAPGGSLQAAKALTDLASAKYGRGERAGAEAMWTEAMALFERLQGPRSSYAAVCRVSLAISLHERGDDAAAEKMLTPALERDREVFGPDHPEFAEDLMVRADIRRAQGRYDEAESDFDGALRVLEAAYGADAIEVGEGLRLRGLLRGLRGNTAAARDDLARAADILVAKLGDTALTARTLRDVAQAHWDAGSRDDAIAAQRRAVDAHRRLLPPGHADLGHTLRDLGYFLDRSGNPEQRQEAVSAFAEAVAVLKPALDPADPLLALTLMLAGQNLLALERADEAAPLLEECLRLREAAADPSPWRIGSTRSALGGARILQGRYAEAETLLTRAYQEITTDTAATEGNLASVLPPVVQRLVDLYERTGRPDDAERWRARRQQK